MTTVLITGASSGYGLETARHLHSLGCDVIATMRRPQPGLLPANMRILPLDVTAPASIAAAVAAAGPVDVLINNAGIGLAGVFESAPMDHIRQVFETNTFGTMAMVQAMIPQMRARRSGVIVNVTSSATLAPMPLVAAYTASKQAIQGFTGSLAHELRPFGLRVKLIEPGYAPTTGFVRGISLAPERMVPPAYGDFARPIFEAFANPPLTTTERDVAEAVWLAINDSSDRLHFPAGPDAVALAA
ncbi:SDR family oxidoreductase [Pseudogemmobacter bohemicus]|uniref:SDR family oxidoreductase n=1 Tax=Pseudogemmobacter bohemicus TaxID=2250708 RepID=UPI000DD3322C|nr:SDR family oxidoreductase [Pseudogemmobacter bohemicus]